MQLSDLFTTVTTYITNLYNFLFSRHHATIFVCVVHALSNTLLPVLTD